MTEADGERRRSFEVLFRKHVAGIASYCRWQLRSVGDIDDAVAEVFLVAWRRLEEVPRGEAARPWLYVHTEALSVALHLPTGRQVGE